MEESARQWLADRAESFLRRAGVREGQTVLDFGCNKGNYAGPAASVVGPSGRVYALDRDAQALEDLKQEARQKGLRNIKCLEVSGGGDIPLPACSVDVVLLYDVLHRGYFPEAAQRVEILRHIYAVLKVGGLLSVYPTHLRKYGMSFAQIMGELRTAGFRLEKEARRRLVHDGNLTRGRVFSFSKDREQEAVLRY